MHTLCYDFCRSLMGNMLWDFYILPPFPIHFLPDYSVYCTQFLSPAIRTKAYSFLAPHLLFLMLLILYQLLTSQIKLNQPEIIHQN